MKNDPWCKLSGGHAKVTPRVKVTLSAKLSLCIYDQFWCKEVFSASIYIKIKKDLKLQNTQSKFYTFCVSLIVS